MSGWRHPLQLTAVTVAAEEDFKVGDRVRLMVHGDLAEESLAHEDRLGNVPHLIRVPLLQPLPVHGPRPARRRPAH